MTESPEKGTTARCSCGNVELQVIGAPIVTAACYCQDCQSGARQIGELRNAPPVLGSDGGTEYVLYRKDRVKFLKGAQSLQGLKLKKESATNRVVATCCNSAMYLSFDKGPHWFSMYRARLQGDVPPVQMRIQTKDKSDSGNVPGEIPSYSGYPVRFVAKLVASKVAMLLNR